MICPCSTGKSFISFENLNYLFSSSHLHQVEELSNKLKGHRNSLTTETKPSSRIRRRNTDRTTWLFTVILILFLLAEFPIVNHRLILIQPKTNCLKGILGLLSAILGKQFFITCYNPLGEIMDMVTLINSGVNFLLYCLMSSQFRNTGKKILGIHKKQAVTTMRRMSVRMEVCIFVISICFLKIPIKLVVQETWC